MNRKLRKLLRDPNRFFFDYFAKRLGSASIFKTSGQNSLISSEDYSRQMGFSFDEKVHPWVQVASRFELRTGATSGHPDQSLLVGATDLLDMLLYTFWVANGFKCAIRIYTLKGDVEVDISRESLWRMQNIEEVYKKIYNQPDFILEFLGEFDNNFSGHVFVYHKDENENIIVRSSNAYVKKASSEVFKKIYPEVVNQFGKWVFGVPNPVDVVYTWVNKDDPTWIALWNKTFPGKPINNDRYASKNELQHSLRALCKYMPWFDKVHIVSNCAKPPWMKDHPRLNWVSHEELFPDGTVLPTFNSHAIEACLHRIPNLNEHFIYVNDDVFVTRPCSYYDFFDKTGRTVAYLEPHGMVFDANLFDATREFLAPAINSYRLIAASVPSWRATRLHAHTPFALKKSILEEIETLIPKELATTRAARMRSADDINLPSFFYHHYALATGRAIEGNARYMIVRPNNIEKLVRGTGIREFKFLCFNDGGGSADNSKYVQSYKILISRTFPKRSGFEIEYIPCAGEENYSVSAHLSLVK